MVASLTKIKGTELIAETDFKGHWSNVEVFIYPNLGREPQTTFPGWWRIWNGILGQPIEMSVNQTSWPIHRKLFLTQRCQESYLICMASVPRRTDKYHTQKIKILTRISARNWRRRMCMKLTCTRSTILFWVRQTIIYKRRKHQTPPSRRSSQANIPWGTWWS